MVGNDIAGVRTDCMGGARGWNVNAGVLGGAGDSSAYHGRRQSSRGTAE